MTMPRLPQIGSEINTFVTSEKLSKYIPTPDGNIIFWEIKWDSDDLHPLLVMNVTDYTQVRATYSYPLADDYIDINLFWSGEDYLVAAVQLASSEIQFYFFNQACELIKIDTIHLSQYELSPQTSKDSLDEFSIQVFPNGKQLLLVYEQSRKSLLIKVNLSAIEIQEILSFPKAFEKIFLLSDTRLAVTRKVQPNENDTEKNAVQLFAINLAATTWCIPLKSMPTLTPLHDSAGEKLPILHVYAMSLSPDGQWLMMEVNAERWSNAIIFERVFDEDFQLLSRAGAFPAGFHFSDYDIIWNANSTVCLASNGESSIYNELRCFALDIDGASELPIYPAIQDPISYAFTSDEALLVTRADYSLELIDLTTILANEKSISPLHCAAVTSAVKNILPNNIARIISDYAADHVFFTQHAQDIELKTTFQAPHRLPSHLRDTMQKLHADYISQLKQHYNATLVMRKDMLEYLAFVIEDKANHSLRHCINVSIRQFPRYEIFPTSSFFFKDKLLTLLEEIEKYDSNSLTKVEKVDEKKAEKKEEEKEEKLEIKLIP